MQSNEGLGKQERKSKFPTNAANIELSPQLTLFLPTLLQ